ncbi:hypothetical protein DV515_00008921, partial [Chloebia gouldiae]
YVTHQPITSPAEVPLGRRPVLEEPLTAQVEPRYWRCPPGTAALAAPPAWLPPEPLPGLALHPEAGGIEREVAKPPLAGVLGRGTGTCQCNCGGSKTLENGGVVLPGGVATADYPLPVLPVPNAIRQKVILGYTGFIPCSMDNVGMTYLLSVKKAMQEFDRRQLLERNPPYTLGTRFPLTHWPDTKIYNRAGLIPNYAGFVPYLQDTCGLTYGDSTRESYRCEQRRRGRALFLLKLSLLLSCGILVLLVLRDQVIHVALSLCELHLIHALARVPVQEGLSAEHRSELLRNAFEQLLDGRAVANEGGRHFEAARWNVTDCCLNVIRNPFNKIAAIFVLNV